jgi:hypothetical protein
MPQRQSLGASGRKNLSIISIQRSSRKRNTRHPAAQRVECVEHHGRAHVFNRLRRAGNHVQWRAHDNAQAAANSRLADQRRPDVD